MVNRWCCSDEPEVIRKTKPSSQLPLGAFGVECLVFWSCPACFPGVFPHVTRHGGHPSGRPRIATRPASWVSDTHASWRSPFGATEDRNLLPLDGHAVYT